MRTIRRFDAYARFESAELTVVANLRAETLNVRRAVGVIQPPPTSPPSTPAASTSLPAPAASAVARVHRPDR